MTITLTNAGKRFNRNWIFRKLSYSFHAGTSYAITGSNGSGKSTLLQVLSGSMDKSEGEINWSTVNCQPSTLNSQLSIEEVYRHIAITAPYLEVIEEMTAAEFLKFHCSFKPLLPSLTISNIIEIIGLKNAGHKQIRFYSSGMKQRIKLAQAVFADVPVLLLDEPCTNFDAAGYELYHQLIKGYCKNKLVIVSSNDVNEYSFCNERISIMNYK